MAAAGNPISASISRIIPVMQLFRIGWTLSRPRELKVSRLPLAGTELAALEALASRGREIAVELSQDVGFRRKFSLPRAAAAHAGGALDVHMRQTMPEGARGLVWRTRQATIADGTVTWDVHVFKSDVISKLRETIESAGGRLGEVRIAGVVGDPLVPRGGDVAKRPRSSVALAAMLFVLPLVAAATAIELRRSDYTAANRALGETIEALQARAIALRSASEENARTIDRRDEVLSAFQADSTRFDLIFQLTAHLPDTVWVSEMSVSGSDLRLSGHTAMPVEDLLFLLESEPGLTDVRLDGAIALDPVRNEYRFDVLAHLNRSGLNE